MSPAGCWLLSFSCLSSIMILRVDNFRGCDFAHAPPKETFVMASLLFPLPPQFENSNIFLGRHVTGNFRHVCHQSVWFGRCVYSSPAQSLLFQCHCNPSLWDIEQSRQTSRDRRSQLFKHYFLFFFRTNHFICTFSIPWVENVGTGTQREILDLFSLLILHLVLETWPCSYSQDEIYSLAPCKLLVASNSPVNFHSCC